MKKKTQSTLARQGRARKRCERDRTCARKRCERAGRDRGRARPAKWLYRDWNDELDPKDVLVSGVWTTVYQDPRDPTRVIKQISAPGVSHCDFSHVRVPTPFRKCTRESCTIPCILAHRICTRFMWESLKRQKEMGSAFFPKIHSMDDAKLRYTCERVPHELEPARCPPHAKDQLYHINDELRRHNVFLDDVHSRNWMLTRDQRLKIVDCEVFTPSELAIQRWLVGGMDSQQKSPSKSYVHASNIIHWQDGRPNLEDVCGL